MTVAGEGKGTAARRLLAVGFTFVGADAAERRHGGLRRAADGARPP
jgi:hypothetical protein